MSQHTNTPQNHTMPAGPAANEMAADADGESACIDSPPELDEAAAYQGFGSFHSDNVEDLIAIPEAKYRVPDALPAWARTLSDPLTAHALSLGRPLTYEEARQVLGHRLRASHFGLDPSWTFVNHGAFGGALKAGMQVKRQFEDLMEEQPLAFVDRTLLPLLVYSTRTLAKFLNARPHDVVLVSNATFGLNAAINAILRTPKDKVAFLDVEYGSVWKMMRERCSHLGCTGVEIPLMQRFSDPAFMASDDAITAYIEEQLPEGTTAFVLDHVSSNTALELPIFTHIVPMLKRKGVQNIIVDGAHGPLQYALDFESLPEEQRPSVYVGNLHKWVACPKSVGFVWTRPDFQKRMHSPVVSHGSRAGYLSEFIWDGTKDYGAYLALPAVLHFWTSVVGAENARRYCRELMSAAERLLCAGWGTQPVPRGAAFMKLVELPAFFQGGKFSGKFVQDALHAQYKVELPVKTVNDKLYVRISTFVNNEVADYEVLRDAVNGLISVLRKRARAPDGTSKLEQSHPAQPLPTKAGGANSGCGGCGLPLGHSRTMGFEEDADDN